MPNQDYIKRGLEILGESRDENEENYRKGKIVEYQFLERQLIIVYERNGFIAQLFDDGALIVNSDDEVERLAIKCNAE